MQINKVTNYEVKRGIALIVTDAPPVNALSHAVREGIIAGVSRAVADTAVKAIVIRCAGRTFYAGADITEFERGMKEPLLTQVGDVIEASAKPVVAAIHGMALGGGLETALVAHFRIATNTARVGLPEVNLGLIPGAGGTQRLPRLVGVTRALDLLTTGAQLSAGEALEMGLLDAICVPEELEEEAIAFALSIADQDPACFRVRDRTDGFREAIDNPRIFDEFRVAHADRFKGFIAPEYNVRAVEAAVRLSFDEGMAEENRLINELFAGSQSKAQQYIFFAQRAGGAPLGLPNSTTAGTLRKVALIGDGDALRGWPERLSQAGVTTVLEQTSAEVTADLVLIDANAELALPPISGDPVMALGGLANANLRDRLAQLSAERAIGLYWLATDGGAGCLEVVYDRLVMPDVLAGAMALGKRLGGAAVATRAAAQPLHVRFRDAFLRQTGILAAAGLPGDAILRALAGHGFGENLLSQVRSVVNKVSAAAPMQDIAATEIIDWMLDAAANEAARALEEGQAGRASDIDVLWVMGLGWPAYDGGPMHRADRAGLKGIVERLRRRYARFGPDYAPAAPIEARALSGAKLADA